MKNAGNNNNCNLTSSRFSLNCLLCLSLVTAGVIKNRVTEKDSEIKLLGVSVWVSMTFFSAKSKRKYVPNQLCYYDMEVFHFDGWLLSLPMTINKYARCACLCSCSQIIGSR